MFAERPPPTRTHRHHPVFQLASVPSTNTLAREGVRAGTLRAGDVLVADEQTTGRGSRGRGWVMVPGRSLAATVVVAFAPSTTPNELMVLAGVAARRVLIARGVGDVTLKWPNDLMRGPHKLGGLLAEAAGPAGAGNSGSGAGRAAHALAVVGLGLNLATRDADWLDRPVAPPASGTRASATRAATPASADLPPGTATRDAVLDAWVDELDAALAELGTPADAVRRQEYVESSWLTGRVVHVAEGDRVHVGRLDAVTGDGDLVLDGRVLQGARLQLRDAGPLTPR